MTHVGGPVPLTSEDYVNRVFERELVKHVNKKDWVLLLGPRQHGKTSALIRLNRAVRESGLRCVFVDLQDIPPGLSFDQLLEWFANEVATSLGETLVTPTGRRPQSLKEWLALAIPIPGPPIVVIIDEASSINDEAMRNSFYGQIRGIKTAAASAAEGSLVTIIQFVFSGTFRPETLVNDLNSPFNVCRRVETDDLTKANIADLARVALGEDDVADVAEAIYQYVGGQPHLAQHMLGVATGYEAAERAAAIDAEFKRLSEQGSDHIDSIFSVVVGDVQLSKIANIAVVNGAVANEPASADYKFLIVIGLMRRDGPNLVFRNALYKVIAESSPQLRLEEAPVVEVPHFFTKDIGAFAFIQDQQYQEISWAAHNGAIASFSAGHFRLALVAFGVALEAMLIDYLERQPSHALDAVVRQMLAARQVRFDTRYEDQAVPSSWKLATQMKIARHIRGANGPAEIPEALREMRNFVHPKVMKATYKPEVELQPDAIAAAGLIGIVMRDIR